MCVENIRLKLTDIRFAWDDIKPKIEALKKEHNFDWRAEDIYSDCLNSNCFLWMCEDLFLIVKQRQNRFTLETDLYIWVAHSDINNAMDEYYFELCQIAKSVNATKIVFGSPRKGFEKIAELNHWKKQESFYEVRVT